MKINGIETVRHPTIIELPAQDVFYEFRKQVFKSEGLPQFCFFDELRNVMTVAGGLDIPEATPEQVKLVQAFFNLEQLINFNKVDTQ